MARGVRWYLVGSSLVLVTLAGCGRSIFQFAEREPWRREAEVACLQSGTVKEGFGVVRIAPIEGPGICGADFPLKVAALNGGRALGFADEVIRPPGSIPNASAQMPRWPIAPSSSPSYEQRPLPPVYQSQPPLYQPQAPVYRAQPAGEPLTIVPPGAPSQPDPPSNYRTAPAPSALGPPRGPQIAAATPVEVVPAATLACPIVSALDRWIADAVQPAAMRWFGRPVVEIKQISAYSCRGMNGQPGARISEHAFGNALDVAAFVLADGHRVTVKDGWRGSPEEQGFLRDVQGAACEQFTTVLAPGSNRFHYDHIHVDLMRRASGRRICEPGAVDGELIAARARGNRMYAVHHQAPPTRVYDPPFDERNDPFAWRGDSARRGDPSVTGSVAARRGPAAGDDDNDWIEDDGPRPPIDWSQDRHRIR